MISHGLNQGGGRVALGLNPRTVEIFNPATPPSKALVDGAGVVTNAASAAAVTRLVATGVGVTVAQVDAAAVASTVADGAGIVQTHARSGDA